ncbi:hypothetical protein AB0I28_38360 [Phytomonospora sp. NPDC050363]|uniref:hypothetical protein n=1 Tax=Phytomonospora sp. NPDC050363 TaxID=3155642 RepID=UPI0033C67A18
MPKITAIADRLLNRLAPKAAADASCGTYYQCDGGPKIKCVISCETGEHVCELVPGWCW